MAVLYSYWPGVPTTKILYFFFPGFGTPSLSDNNGEHVQINIKS